ncbi:MAG: aldehyde dehydrogenase family protein, partial [bacterium]|nr:aldehyde dehydrogenase family protein [bacterium]
MSELSIKTIYSHWINGAAVEWNGETIPVHNPATGESISTVARGTARDVDAAVKSARLAFENPKWTRLTGVQRGKLLLKFARLIEENLKPLSV